MLLFKKKFLDAIRQGRKTQTVRLWKWRKMKPGQRSYIPGAGYIQVVTVDEVALPELTDDDARLDGFESADTLRREIEQLYPKQLAAGYRAFRIRFTLLPADVQRQMRLEKKQSTDVLRQYMTRLILTVARVLSNYRRLLRYFKTTSRPKPAARNMNAGRNKRKTAYHTADVGTDLISSYCRLSLSNSDASNSMDWPRRIEADI